MEEFDAKYKCPICLELLCKPITLSCGHNFCDICIHEIKSMRCPMCNKYFDDSAINHLLCDFLEEKFKDLYKSRGEIVENSKKILKKKKEYLRSERCETLTMIIEKYAYELDHDYITVEEMAKAISEKNSGEYDNDEIIAVIYNNQEGIVGNIYHKRDVDNNSYNYKIIHLFDVALDIYNELYDNKFKGVVKEWYKKTFPEYKDMNDHSLYMDRFIQSNIDTSFESMRPVHEKCSCES